MGRIEMKNPLCHPVKVCLRSRVLRVFPLALILMACTMGEFLRDYKAGAENYDAGLAALREGRYDNAISYFDMAIFELKFAYRDWQWQIDRVDAQAPEARRIRQYIGRSYIYMAMAHYQKKQYTEAIKAIDAAFEIPVLEDEDRVTAYATRGLAYHAMGDRLKAGYAYWNGVALHIDSLLLDDLKNKLFKR